MTRRIIAFSAAGLFLIACSAQAATWVGDIDNDWFGGTNGVDTNWSDNKFPDSTTGNTDITIATTVNAGSATPINLGSNLLRLSGSFTNTLNLLNAQSLTTSGAMTNGSSNSSQNFVNLSGTSSLSLGSISLSGGANSYGEINISDDAVVTTTSISGACNASNPSSFVVNVTDDGKFNMTSGTSQTASGAGGSTATFNLSGSSITTNSGTVLRLGQTGTGTLNLTGSAQFVQSGSGRIATSRGAGTTVINLTSGTYSAAGLNLADIGDDAQTGGVGSVAINIGSAAISASQWDLNNGDPTTVAITGATGGSVTFSRSVAGALSLNNAATTLELNLDSFANGGIRLLDLTGANGTALLAGMNLELNPLSGFAINAGQSLDVVRALNGIDITGAGGLTSFVDNTGAAFSLSVVSLGGNSEVLRLTATQTVLVPEPASLALPCLAGLLITWRRRYLASI